MAGGSALYNLWSGITGDAKVPMGNAKYWDLQREPRRAFTTTEFYGCTVVLIADANHAVIGHFHEETGDGTKVMDEANKVQKNIIERLQSCLDEWDMHPTGRAWIIQSSRSGRSVGYNLIHKLLVSEYGMHGDRIRNCPYSSGSSTGEFPDSPRGKAVLQWQESATGGTLNVYIQKENPDVYSYDGNGVLL